MSATQSRAAIYVRVSTAGQEEEGTSLTSQEEQCRRYAAEQGYDVDEAHIYREVYTGTELWDRPLLTRLREAIRQREVRAVVAYAIDRLARDPVHLGVIISEAEHAGVDVRFVSEPLDNSPEGQLIRFVRGYAAKVEHEKIRERSVRGKRARVEAGKLHNHSAELYGYRRDKERGVRTVHEPEAAVVREIYRLTVEEHASLRSVVRQLNESGTPVPSIGKRDYGRETYWGKSTIRRILREPAYKGETIVWRWQMTKGETKLRCRPESDNIRLPDGTTPALVSAATWDAAQA